MSQRTLLIVALALMAGGLLSGGLGLVIGNGSTQVQSAQFGGPRQGAAGGFLPRRPGFGPGAGPRRGVPFPGVSPKPSPTA